MPTSNIDDLLLGGSNTQHPMPIEEKAQTTPEPIEELNDDYNEPQETNNEPNNEEIKQPIDEQNSENDLPETEDEYGNKDDLKNEGIRERLARQARKHEAEVEALRMQLAQQNASPQVQQAAQDFEYNPDKEGDWQQQLRDFVKQTVTSMTREEQDKQARYEQQQEQIKFETKFRSGMERFNDFKEILSSLPFEISNPMTMATRSMENPAAFLYAAAKRNPQELERIARLRDPYAQIAEMGRLEERMRKQKTGTQAPRPLGKAHEDATTNVPQKAKEPNGNDLLAQADAKRLAKVQQRLKNSR